MVEHLAPIAYTPFMSLTMNDLEHVLTLSQLKIDEHEKADYLSTLHDVLAYMKCLDDFSLDKANPSSHAHLNPHRLREDRVQAPFDLLLEKNAPQWENNSFSVPKILEEL